MLFYPLFVAVISLVFSAAVLMQWAAKRRRQQLVWGVALAMAALASFAFAGFLSGGSELLFRLYYVFGALMMAAYLGMGSLYLVLPRRGADRLLAVLVVLSLIGAALVLTAPIDTAALHRLQQTSGAGTDVLKPGLWRVGVIVLNSFGALAVIAVALYSAYKVVQRQAPVRFVVANVTIAVGTGIISETGSAAGLGSPNYFWVFMAVGWAVIFAGFLLTTNLAAVNIGARDASVGRGAAPA